MSLDQYVPIFGFAKHFFYDSPDLTPEAFSVPITQFMASRSNHHLSGAGPDDPRFAAMQLSAASARPLSGQIFDLLSMAIEKGVLKPGERLPPERELMKQLGVSRGTLRTALSELIAGDYLSATQGRGNFVKEAPQQKELQILALESFRIDLLPVEPLHYGWINDAAKAVKASVYYRYTPAVEELAETLLAPPSGYDGILIFRAVPDWSQAMEEMPSAPFANCPVPVLILGRTIAKSAVDMVSWDYREAARLATHELVKAGHRRIGFIGGRPVKGHSFADFQTGYLEALSEAGLTADPRDAFYREGPLGVELRDSNRALAEFLRHRSFTAALVALVAQPVEQVCQEEGIEVPDDLELRLVGEQFSFEVTKFPWIGYAEPSAEIVKRGFKQFAETCRGRSDRGRHQLIAPAGHRR